jgi:hypothetical protein
MRNGTGTLPAIELRTVATGYGTGIFKGDPLIILSDGTVAVAPAVSSPVYAIADGAEQYWDGTAIRRGNYLPASTSWGTVRERRSVVRCIPVRDAVFEADADDATSLTTETAYEGAIGNNVSHAAGSGGSTSSGLSSYSLDISTTATTQGVVWRIIGISSTAENQDFTGTGVKLLVEANVSDEPQFNGGTTGV